jgi:hypothetical protein
LGYLLGNYQYVSLFTELHLEVFHGMMIINLIL